MRETSDHELTVYRPGLTLASSMKASLARFLPGAVLSLSSVMALLDFPSPSEWLQAAAMMLTGVGVLTAGFAAGLEGLRRWLYPDAKITGRRSFIAGLLAPIAVFVVGALLNGGVSPLQTVGLLFIVPLSLACLMFFAWLTPTPEELRYEEYIDPDELPGLLIASWTTVDPDDVPSEHLSL